MDEKLKNVIRLINELQLAMKEDPDILSAYITIVEDTDIPKLQVYKGDRVKFTDERKHENGMLEKYAIIDGVHVLSVCWEAE